MRDKKIETFLYCLAQLMRNPEMPFADRAQSIAEIIPQSISGPFTASAFIRLDQQEFQSPGYSEDNADHTLFEPVYIAGRQRGMVKVIFFRETGRPAGDAEFIVREERRLVRTIAHHLSLMLEKEEGDIRTSKLEAQVRHADRLAKVGQLAAGFAHEISNPLNNILGFAQLAAGVKGLPEQAAGDIEKIIQSALHAREVVKKLMLYSRQAPPAKQEVDLNEVVKETLNFMKHQCHKQNIRIVQKKEVALERFAADPLQLRQVIVNLIMNAIQAMPDGGTLTIRTRRVRAGLRLTIEDTGTGMEPAILERIFHPFFTTKEISQGTGLGLSVVQGILETHGAEVLVSSKVGAGSVFSITFPLENEEA